MKTRMFIMLLGVAVVLGGIFGFKAFVAHMIALNMAAMGGFPQTVATTVAASESWRSELQSVGNLRAENGADLSFEVAGVVDAIHFTSGAEVQKGATLLTLRSQDDVAKLQSLQAASDLAAKTLARDLEELKVQAVSQATIDTDNDTLASDRALVVQQQAIIDKKTLKAPFAGRLGIRAVDLGQYLEAGTTVVTLQSLDVLFVDFTLPQQDLSTIAMGQAVTATVEGFSGQEFAGRIVAISPRADASTRSLQIRAQIDNALHRLLPNMYATLSVDTGKATRYITLPQTAVTFSADGDTVYVVDTEDDSPAEHARRVDQAHAALATLHKDLTEIAGTPQPTPAQVDAVANDLQRYRPLAGLLAAPAPAAAPGSAEDSKKPAAPPRKFARRRLIVTGERRGDQVAVVSGIKEGEEVVIAGQIKLHNGSEVMINNTVLPSDEPHPQPVDH